MYIFGKKKKKEKLARDIAVGVLRQVKMAQRNVGLQKVRTVLGDDYALGYINGYARAKAEGMWRGLLVTDDNDTKEIFEEALKIIGEYKLFSILGVLRGMINDKKDTEGFLDGDLDGDAEGMHESLTKMTAEILRVFIETGKRSTEY